jgi:hypothetical protein
VYILGQGANTLNAATNNPQKPQLVLEEVALFPTYIRFQPNARDDRWNLERVEITFNDADIPAYQSMLETQGGIWLGTRSGQAFHPRKHIDLGTKWPPG